MSVYANLICHSHISYTALKTGILAQFIRPDQDIHVPLNYLYACTCANVILRY